MRAGFACNRRRFSPSAACAESGVALSLNMGRKLVAEHGPEYGRGTGIDIWKAPRKDLVCPAGEVFWWGQGFIFGVRAEDGLKTPSISGVLYFAVISQLCPLNQ